VCQFTVLIAVAAINRAIRWITHTLSQAILIRTRFIGDISNSVACVPADRQEWRKLENFHNYLLIIIHDRFHDMQLMLIDVQVTGHLIGYRIMLDQFNTHKQRQIPGGQLDGMRMQFA